MGRKSKKHASTKISTSINENQKVEVEPSVKPKTKSNTTASGSTISSKEQPITQKSTKLDIKDDTRKSDDEVKAVLKNVSSDIKDSQKRLSLKDLVFAITKAAADRKKAAGSTKKDHEMKDEFGSLLRHIKKDDKMANSKLASSKPLSNEEGIAEIMQLIKAKEEIKKRSASSDSLPNITESLLDSTNRAKLSKDNSSVSDGAKEELGTCQYCEKEAITQCTGCRKVFYCSKECQKLHWKSHKDVCRPYKVGKIEGFGRVLVATRSISPEEEVLKERPFALGPRPNNETLCLSCYRRISGLYRCPKCAWPMCDEECSKGATHAIECDVCSRASLGGPSGLRGRGYDDQHYEIITALRCLVAYQQDPSKWSTMLDKFGARQSLVNSNSLQHHHRQQTIVEPLRTALKIGQHPVLSKLRDPDIHTVLNVLQVHSVPSRSSHGEVTGLYPMASLLGHSCVPNTRTRFQGEHLVITATEDITAGTPLTAMFTDILWGTKARRDQLQQTRFFSCSCRRCSDPTELGSYFSALVCPKCREPVLPSKPLVSTAFWSCTACKHQISSDDLLENNLTLGSEAAHELMNPTIQGLENLLSRWLPKVHTHHYHLHAIKHSLLQLYGREGEKKEIKDDNYWKEITKKEKLCQEFLKVCSLLDPSMAHSVPQFGLAFYELHKSVLECAKRNYGLTKLDNQQLKKKMQLAKALLRRSMDILMHEAEETPEGVLHARCQEEFISIGQWMLSVGLA